MGFPFPKPRLDEIPTGGETEHAWALQKANRDAV
jgi:hypothetical protein